MIKLGGLIDLRPQWLGEAEDDKYASIGFGRYKEKGKEDDENAPTFKKDDSGKYVPTGDKAAKGGDSPAKKDTPKVNIFDKPKKDKEAPKKDKKSDTPKLNIDTDDMGDYDGMSSDTSSEVENYLNKELGLDGSSDINSGGAIEYNIPGSTDTLFIGNDEKGGKPFSVSLGNEDGMDPDNTYKAFDNSADAMAYAKELGQKLKGGAGDEPKKDEPKKDDGPQKDSTGGRAGNIEVNKSVRLKTKRMGITPKNLGKEEYERRMSQAAVEALTDANFHSEARKLIAMLEDNPDFAKDPRQDPNMPDIMSPEYDKWRKSSVYGSEFYDSSPGTDEIGQHASQEAGWDGRDALDAIAFDLKVNGSKNLALKMQSVIDDTNESTMRLTKMEIRK